MYIMYIYICIYIYSLQSARRGIAPPTRFFPVSFFFLQTVCWWHMACGAVLGVHDGMIIEYDASTLAPLGMVVSKDELAGRQVKRSTGHTHTHTHQQRTTPPTPTHTLHPKPPNEYPPQTLNNARR